LNIEDINLLNETKQSELLGVFNKKNINLPIDKNSINMNLINICSNDIIENKTSDIIQQIINNKNKFKINYSPSGFGKTFALTSVSIKEISIFCICNADKLSNGTRSSDSSFYQFFSTILKFNQNDYIFHYNNIILKFILVRITYLYLQLLKNEKNLTPKNFYISQINDNQKHLLGLYNFIEKNLKNISNNCLENLIKEISLKIKNKKIEKINFILDESNYLLRGSENKYISLNGTMRCLLIKV
jgi:hypothetical protein